MSLPWLHTQVADNCSMPTAEEMAAVKVDNARDYYDIVKVKLRKSSHLLPHNHTTTHHCPHCSHLQAATTTTPHTTAARRDSALEILAPPTRPLEEKLRRLLEYFVPAVIKA